MRDIHNSSPGMPELTLSVSDEKENKVQTSKKCIFSHFESFPCNFGETFYIIGHKYL
jgi:hypothetical protein